MILRTVYAIFLALDLLLSALTFAAPLQTLSARSAKAKQRGGVIGMLLCQGLDWLVLRVFGEENHCESSLAAYEARIAAAPSWNG